jgi:light-regulated signal transduction histidine kinase (bacteriophytochrome)
LFPVLNDNLIGSLTLGMDKPGKLSAEQSGIASEVATQLAVALQQARLHEKVQDYADHLETMVDERTAQLQDKSSEMEAFTYSVSHDLRAPLRAMDGFSRMLMSEYQNDLPERAHHYLNRIQANASRMGVLIDDLLALSRVGRHELQRKIVQTRQIVQSVLDELDANDQIGHSEIQVGDLPPCHADATLLRQVYFNLITNAIKYSSNRDTSKIEIGSELQDDQKLVYYVKDNGVGFDMQYADKLFGVFQRLHNSEGYDGTGIGLATVKRILARHGGDIWATAKENEGAAFYFSFGDLPEENEAYGE